MAASVLLFGRDITVTVDTIQIKGLAMSFKIKKSLKPEPNSAEITIQNLNLDHISSLETMKVAQVTVEAGYLGGTSLLFSGDLRTGYTSHDGTNYVTKLSTGDGEKSVKKSRVKVSMKKGTATPKAVLEAVAKSLGVGAGNLPQALAALGGAVNHWSEGTVIDGSSYREMNAICKSLGLSWSVQDGKLQILTLKKALEGEAIKVSEKTGMVGSPTVDNDGVYKFKTLLIPDMFPGRAVVLDSERLKGQCRLEKVEYSGDTHGQDWYANCEAKRY